MRLHRSSNFSSRNNGGISMLVLHYTGMESGAAAIERLCDPHAKVSAHYVVDEGGAIFPLVSESECAWHAGVSYWRGHQNVNEISVGIEIVNPGHEWGYRAFPKVQMETVAVLCADIIERHKIPARNVVGHSDIAPARKQDPGELFDWKWLAERGVGLWPKASDQWPVASEKEAKKVQARLTEYGYLMPSSGQFDEETIKVITAFQRHFRPRQIDGVWDAECEALLAGLLALV